MGDAKRIIVKPVSALDAKQVVARHHYSGKSTQNSQLHLGVFLDGELHGAMQFGPSIDKRRMLGLVEGTQWENFCELNRMAFGPALPRNSESRALAIAFRLINKNCPQIKWVVSFADGTQCGDGTIYRASGFLLTSVRRNATLLVSSDGLVVANKTLKDVIGPDGESLATAAHRSGSAKPMQGFQLRYIKFLDEAWRSRLTCPVIPFSAIAEAGASMYLGKARSGSKGDVVPGLQPGEGGSTPTPELQPRGKP